ncbi:unnamed protein product [Periconia digitata]|uniref:Peptidase M43 pregnancy-associated plasma-A domain-containing protein n=1 Tax=Periconia digitata TaxID=1303443 RepID=A0A9W4UPB9_9PLEO|nr:unnamed protein product [Periconia digitata]
MKSFTYLSALMGVSSAYVYPRGTANKAAGFVDSDCPSPGEDFWALSAMVAGEEKMKRELLEQDPTNVTLSARADVTIDTYIHIVATGPNQADGMVLDDQIMKQMVVINDAFNKRGFSFKLAGTSRTVSQDLAIIDNKEEKTEKLGAKFRRGNYQALNLYIVKDMPGNIAGDCSLPMTRHGGKYLHDGCRFNYDTLPAKGDGKVLVHEIGHWLGLAHTFQEGDTNTLNPSCTAGHGDDVADTPVHLRPQTGSCDPVKSCPGVAGSDPVSNFMNYTPSKCWTGFTDGQATRMHSMWEVRKNAK